jgi:hypothetical protein
MTFRFPGASSQACHAAPAGRGRAVAGDNSRIGVARVVFGLNLSHAGAGLGSLRSDAVDAWAPQ